MLYIYTDIYCVWCVCMYIYKYIYSSVDLHRKSYQNGCEIYAYMQNKKNVFLVILENNRLLIQERLIYIYQFESHLNI